MGQNIQALALCLWLQHIHSDLVLLSKKNSRELFAAMANMLLCYRQPCKTFRAYVMNSTVSLGTHLTLTLVPCQISRCKDNLSHCPKSKIAWTSCSHA